MKRSSNSKNVTGYVPVPYSAQMAAHICDLIAQGYMLKEIEATDGLPSASQIRNWRIRHPKFAEAFETALTISAMSFEEEAIELARELSHPGEITGIGVRAKAEAMGQFRWSASRRDQRRYGQSVANTIPIVPVQIVTTLNLGQPGVDATEEKSVYDLRAQIVQDIEEAEITEDPNVPLPTFNPDFFEGEKALSFSDTRKKRRRKRPEDAQSVQTGSDEPSEPPAGASGEPE